MKNAFNLVRDDPTDTRRALPLPMVDTANMHLVSPKAPTPLVTFTPAERLAFQVDAGLWNAGFKQYSVLPPPMILDGRRGIVTLNGRDAKGRFTRMPPPDVADSIRSMFANERPAALPSSIADITNQLGQVRVKSRTSAKRRKKT
jgi:hypothetical protein